MPKSSPSTTPVGGGRSAKNEKRKKIASREQKPRSCKKTWILQKPDLRTLKTMVFLSESAKRYCYISHVTAASAIEGRDGADELSNIGNLQFRDKPLDCSF